MSKIKERNRSRTFEETVAKVDQERLFGEGVDLYKNYHAVLGIFNILKTIGVRTSKDSDWFRAAAAVLTTIFSSTNFPTLPAEIVEVLETEVVSKMSGASCKGLGEIVSKMGF